MHSPSALQPESLLSLLPKGSKKQHGIISGAYTIFKEIQKSAGQKEHSVASVFIQDTPPLQTAF
jgi:hypothetical protein